MKTYEAQAHSYADIIKAEKQEDGSVMIYGRPTKEELDVDHQIADKEWAKKALPEWYKWANIREMHRDSAVGVGQKLEFDEKDDPFIQARITDPQAAQKVLDGVYKGLSIGIKDPVIQRDKDAPNGRIVGGEIVEISVVDRPAVSSAKFALMKMVGASEYLDTQLGFTIKMSPKNAYDGTEGDPTNGDELNPSDFDQYGNPIDQPGHLKDVNPAPTDEPTIISQDTNSINVRVGDKTYQVPLDMDSNGNVVIGEPEEVDGMQPEGMDWETGKRATKAVWSTEYVDSLPDSAFAYVSPGGDKSDRHLPYKDKDGNVDAAHVRNALARLDQTDIPPAAKAEAKKKLEAAAKEVGIDMEEKVAQMAEKAASGRKVLCQACKKSVAIKKTLTVNVLDGGARVEGIGDCNHTVRMFVKSADMKDAGGDNDGDNAKDDDKKNDVADKGADAGVTDDAKDEDSTSKEEDDVLEKKFAAMLDRKFAELVKSIGVAQKDANPDDTDKVLETRKKRIKDLRDAHQALGDKIDEYAAEDIADAVTKAADAVGADTNGGPSRVRGTDPREIIREMRSHLATMQSMIEEGEKELGHSDVDHDADLGDDVVAPAKKPAGDGRLNLTSGDIKAAVAQAIKSVQITPAPTLDKGVVPDIGKAVADAVKGVMEPMLSRLEKVEHMAQPSPFLVPMDKGYTLNAPEQERATATKSIQEEMRKLSPKDQARVLASSIAKDRGWQ